MKRIMIYTVFIVLLSVHCLFGFGFFGFDDNWRRAGAQDPTTLNVTDNGGEAFRVTDNGGEDYVVR